MHLNWQVRANFWTQWYVNGPERWRYAWIPPGERKPRIVKAVDTDAGKMYSILISAFGYQKHKQNLSSVQVNNSERTFL